MNRKITNLIRFIFDEFLPPLLRDNRFFMYPFFFLWFKGKNVSRLMSFKDSIHLMGKDEYNHFYKIYDSLPSRETDLNQKTLKFILSKLENRKEAKIIDVGCGSGYLLKRLKNEGFKNLTGCDINPPQHDNEFSFLTADIENLPFGDNEFDVVICNHTIEHVIDLGKAVDELKRISGKMLIVTVPCQRYYHYTFDLHVHFFPEMGYLLNTMKIQNHECYKLDGDFCFVGNLSPIESIQ